MKENSIFLLLITLLFCCGIESGDDSGEGINTEASFDTLSFGSFVDHTGNSSLMFYDTSILNIVQVENIPFKSDIYKMEKIALLLGMCYVEVYVSYHHGKFLETKGLLTFSKKLAQFLEIEEYFWFDSLQFYLYLPDKKRNFSNSYFKRNQLFYQYYIKTNTRQVFELVYIGGVFEQLYLLTRISKPTPEILLQIRQIKQMLNCYLSRSFFSDKFKLYAEELINLDRSLSELGLNFDTILKTNKENGTLVIIPENRLTHYNKTAYFRIKDCISEIRNKIILD